MAKDTLDKQTQEIQFNEYEQALIHSAIKLQVKSHERAAKSHRDAGRPAVAQLMENEIAQLNQIVAKIK